MRNMIINSLLALIACVSLTGVANAQDKAGTLDQLLKIVKDGRVAETKEHKRRESQFLAAKNKQASLLKKAQAELAAEERTSEKLEVIFNRNEEDLAALSEVFSKKSGSLRELFGVLQQVSGDTRSKIEASVVSAQYPGRGDFLDELAKKMGTATELATIEEIERVIYELQREMTEAGKVVKFQATVTKPDGENSLQDVVRVGAFNLVSDGQYLTYDPETGSLVELPRQPAGRYTATADDLGSASAGFVEFGIDPAKGQILKLLVQAPNILERINQGGLVGYIIIIVGIIALLLALNRLFVLNGVNRKVNAQIASKTAMDDNPLGRVLQVYDGNKSIDTETLELKLSEAILKETPALLKFVTLLKIIAVVAPLMGLLGTVTGMINTFQAITLFGTGDPKLMAGGISQALVTTVLGLCVAIPITLLHSIVNSRSKAIIHVLEEQSAGMIASHNEAS